MKRLIFFLLLFTTLSGFSQSFSKSWKDINYAGDSMNFHKLDIYLPKEVKPEYPVVISIYGSAWLANNAKGADLPTLGKALLEAGFAVVTPNHRSSMDAKFPAQVDDIKAVIRFVRANAEKYRLDTSFVGITGSSSGGSLAAMAGTSGNVKKFTLGSATADIEGTTGANTAFSSSVDAVVDWFGPTNMLLMDSCGGTDFIHNDVKSPASLYIGGPIQENKDKTLLASPITYIDLFEDPNRIYFEVGDSMGYVSDIKNKDARTEGLSYGMMVAVQLDKKEVFDRIWRWSKKYLQHQSGPREAYFAWSFNPQTMKQNSPGSASDGELYYVTSLLFAANRWGIETGIDYYAEARRILDAMWKKDGTGNIYNLINVEHKQITFVPEGNNYNWTDPSYHLPAFYEIWAEYANDGHEQFYSDCADTSRVFLHRACHSVTGLNYDYTEFSGEPHSTPWMPAAFRYDSWRVPMNIAQDYVWYGKDKKWQEDYAKRFQGFLRSKGIDNFEDQFNPDGTTPEFILQAGGFKKLRHSLGLKSTAATTSLIGNDEKSLDFVHALWNAKLEPYEDGYFDPYYDGLLYMFSLMHLSGKYRIITPQNN